MGDAIHSRLPLGKIKTDAPYVIYSRQGGIVSEHGNRVAAREAFFETVGRFKLGMLPCIYKRRPEYWEPD
jgi:hypothetical protein